MKKVFLVLCLTVAAFCTLNAQTNDMTLGGRLGYDLEASFQLPVGAGNRVEIDAGFGFFYNGINIGATYQWVWNIAGIQGFDWFVGPGAFLGIYSFNNPWFAVGVEGQIGLEYNFKFPLQLSLDYRPTINFLGFGNNRWGNWTGVALGVRYRF